MKTFYITIDIDDDEKANLKVIDMYDDIIYTNAGRFIDIKRAFSQAEKAIKIENTLIYAE